MSSDLERLVRDAREALPMPAEDVTTSAREHVLIAMHKRRARMRTAYALAGVALVTIVAATGLGALGPTKGTAARESAGIGLLPAPGWHALQASPATVVGQPVVAVASNVPFARDDVVRGLADPSGLPYSTLLRLPPTGVVVVASLTQRTTVAPTPIPVYPEYRDADLPLSIQDATPAAYFPAQVRPDEPLGQYELRAHVRGYNVDIRFYFGVPRPSAGLLAATQRQLDRLVVAAAPSPAQVAGQSTANVATTTGPPSVFDRTYSCTTALLGGLYQLTSRAHGGQRVGGVMARLPYAAVLTGFPAEVADLGAAPSNSLAWITAGSPVEQTTAGETWESFRVRAGGTVGVNPALCKPTSARIPLAPTGLVGGTMSSQTRSFDCAARKVVVRVRVRFAAPASLRDRGQGLLVTTVAARAAELAVRTAKGRPLSYANLTATGTTRLFVARTCIPD